MKSILINLAIVIAIVSCGEKNEANIKSETFDLCTHYYQINYEKKSYPILLDEYDFYLMLENHNLVKNKKEYFVNRSKLLATTTELDFTSFKNYIGCIVFLDSCNKLLVNKQVQDIENNPELINKQIILDSTINLLNSNCIYYTLISDSFQLCKDDVSGYFILSK